MSQPGHGSPAVPPAARHEAGWPITPPPHRSLRSGDPAAVGPFRLDAVLGEGGMGRVFLGRTPAGSALAIKVVHREYAAAPSFRKRFAQEVATARRVQGIYTVPVVDADIQADEPWLATAYISGPSLQYAVAEHGPLPVEATLRLVARVAEALQSIHAAGVIHRDLKPSKVIRQCRHATAGTTYSRGRPTPPSPTRQSAAATARPNTPPYSSATTPSRLQNAGRALLATVGIITAAVLVVALIASLQHQ